MALTMANFEAALKEMYPDSVIKDMTYKDNPFLAMVPKDESAGGELIKVPVIYANPQGQSAALSTAITNKGNTHSIAWLLTRSSYYSVASISREVLLASQGRAEAFAEAAEVEVDGALNGCARALAKALYRDGNGYIGRESAVTAPTVANPMVLQLADINDITNFEVGQVIVADDTITGASLRATPATATLAAVDRDLGTLTTGYDNSMGATDWAVDDYFFIQGVIATTALPGLAAWLPAAAPAATSFYGIDRTADTVRLGGNRVTGTGMPVEQALLKAAAKVAREGGSPDVAFLNPVQYHEMIVSLGGKVEYVKQGATAEVFFSGVRIHGPKGPVEVYPDFNCPSQRAYVLQKDTCKLYSLKPAPHIFDLDNEGLSPQFLREATADNYEIRTGWYAVLGVSCPGYNATISLDAATF